MFSRAPVSPRPLFFARLRSQPPLAAWLALAAALVLDRPTHLAAQMQPPPTGQPQAPVGLQVPVVTNQTTAGRRVPGAAYYAAFNSLYEGDYKSALEMFQGNLRGAVRTLQSEWIDSICYHTMVGEAYYRIGDYPKAMDQYNAALQLYIKYSDWMLRIQFPPTIQPAGISRGTPWGKSARGAQLGSFKENWPMVVGSLDGGQAALTQGGAFQRPEIIPVDVKEIVRCTCLSMMRRRQLLGPLTTYDPFSDQLIGVASRRQTAPNHWSEAWIDLIQGFAYGAGGKSGQAVEKLTRGLLVQGQLDHPLSALARLELGNLALAAGDLKSAATNFEEATYSAFDFSSREFADASVLQEAFEGWFQTQLLGGALDTFQNRLQAAANWARPTKFRELQASLGLSMAESLLLAGKTQPAAAIFDELKPIMARRTMAITGIGSRLNYLTAMANYQRGQIQAGDTALMLSLGWQKEGSKWLYQISLADNLCMTNPGGRFQPRTATAIYEQLVRDPGAADWSTRPIESLAVMAVPQIVNVAGASSGQQSRGDIVATAYDHWFEFALQVSTDVAGGALEVADLSRRHRFLGALPLGGRLFALRWLLESPEDALSNTARIQRQQLLVHYPKYGDLSQKVQTLRADIAALAANAEKEQQRELATKMNELATLSAAQEGILREMAVSREPADIVFPPQRKAKELQQSMPSGHILLAFYSTRNGMYAWLFSSQKNQAWKIANPAQLDKRVTALVRALGNVDASRELTEAQLADPAWKQAARDVLDGILQNSKINFSDDAAEVTIVPDGMLWYLPFEVLPLGADVKEFRPLLSRSKVRYAPTVGLSTPDRQGRKSAPQYAIVSGKLYPSDTPAIGEAAIEQVRRATPNAMVIKNPLAAASPLYGALVDGLIVLDETGEPTKATAAEKRDDPLTDTALPRWAPIPLDKSRSSGMLGDWLAQPWKTVDQFILPGFHSAAENGLKATGSPPGNDMFLSTTALLATGARTVLISRWRTGGDTAIGLTREFLQELPFVTAAEAWQRAVQVVGQSPLDGQREPRLVAHRASQQEVDSLKADHPFFWSGYMLVDTGASPQVPEKVAEKPLLKFEGKKEAEKAAAEQPKAEVKAADQKPEKMDAVPPAGDDKKSDKSAEEMKPEYPKPDDGKGGN
jgi:CHAT domain